MTSAKWTAQDLPRLEGRTFVVTGANSGIGLAASRALGRAGARVVLAVRDVAKGEAAAASIEGHPEVRELDLADLGSVRAFADAWDGDLDVLVNNAGVMAVPERRTKDGFEMQLGTNHLGHFALTNLLLPHVRDRVVVVVLGRASVRLHPTSTTSTGSTTATRAGAPTASRSSPTCSSCQSSSAASTTRARASARSPRTPATPRPTSSTAPRTWCRTRCMALGNRVLAQSEEMGALPTLFAATQDLPGDTYVGPDGLAEQRGHPKVVGRSGAARDAETAARLWERSEELTGVAFPLTPAVA